jgi:hypothetical protein
MRGLGLAVMLALAPATGMAQTLDQALTAWLEGDDALALPMLAALADGGDAKAQLTLAMIEQRWPSPFIEGLTREARRAIFRKGDVGFGTSWLNVAQSGPMGSLAAALAPYGKLSDHAQVAQMRREAGEQGQAVRVLLALANQDQVGLVAYDAAHPLPASMRWIVWTAAYWATTYSDRNDMIDAALAEAAAAPEGLQRWVYLSFGGAEELGLTLSTYDLALADDLWLGEAMGFGGEADQNTAIAMEAVLMAAPETAALRAACAAHCTGMEPACTRTLYSLARGLSGVALLTSPLEAAIDQGRYETSRRYLMDLRDMARNVPRKWITPAPGASCAFALVDAP